MTSLNKVIIIGNLGKDPEVRSTSNGKKVANLTVATSEKWVDKNTNEKKEKTEWHRISIFSEGLASVCEKYLKKGSKVYIEGQLQTRKWQDQQGQDRYSTEVVLQGFDAKLIILDSAKNAPTDNHSNSEFAKSAQHYEAKQNGFQPQDDLDDEIPF